MLKNQAYAMALLLRKKRIMLFSMVLGLSVIMLILTLDSNRRNSNRYYQGQAPNFASENLMDSSKYNNFRSHHYGNLCSSLPPLTYIEKRNNHFDVILKINVNAIPLYTPLFSVNCCYSKAKRYVTETNTDDHLRFSECLPFRDSVNIIDPIIKTVCKNQSNVIVYTNIHVIISPMFLPYLEENTYELLGRRLRPVKVLLFGFDGMSKHNLKRKMPKSYDYLHRNGFFNIDLSASLLEIFNGSLKGQPNNNSCGFDIWDEFKKGGYFTALGEDSSANTLFTGRNNTILQSPIDIYFKPYMLEAANLERNNREAYYCASPEDKAERIMNLAKDFQIALNFYPTFALFIINSFSYTMSSALDTKTRNFLENFDDHSLKNTIFLFFSNFKSTVADNIKIRSEDEELSFLYIYLPKSFDKPYWNLGIRPYEKTNPLDLYLTLKDILRVTATNDIIDRSSSSVDCPSGQSLLIRMANEEKTYGTYGS